LNINNGGTMNKYKYIVWVGGSPVGEYTNVIEAEILGLRYESEGYDDVAIEHRETEEKL